MDDDLQRRRCETCEHEITGLARLARHGRKIAALERFDATPPPLPAGATLDFWAALPCLHPLDDVAAWDWAIDAGWGELPGLDAPTAATPTLTR